MQILSITKYGRELLIRVFVCGFLNTKVQVENITKGNDEEMQKVFLKEQQKSRINQRTLQFLRLIYNSSLKGLSLYYQVRV